MTRRVKVRSVPLQVGSGSFVFCPCCNEIDLGDGTLTRATALAREHVALHQAAPDGRLPLYPWSDGTRRTADPTHGQHTHRVQWHVEQLQPSDRSQRAALERTITDRLAVLGIEAALMPLPAEAWSLPEEDA